MGKMSACVLCNSMIVRGFMPCKNRWKVHGHMLRARYQKNMYACIPFIIVRFNDCDRQLWMDEVKETLQHSAKKNGLGDLSPWKFEISNFYYLTAPPKNSSPAEKHNYWTSEGSLPESFTDIVSKWFKLLISLTGCKFKPWRGDNPALPDLCMLRTSISAL